MRYGCAGWVGRSSRAGIRRPRSYDALLRLRILLATVLGLVLGVLLLLVVDAPLAVISGITVAELIFLLRSWWVLWPKDAEATHEHAGDEDLDPAVDATLVAGALGLA